MLASLSANSSFRLLCVDDDRLLLEALALAFEAYGFEVVTAFDGIEALRQFQTHDGNFKAILTDNDMPNMNGLVLVKHLRALGYRESVLIMSGCLTREDGRAYHDLEVNGFLHKPFEIGVVAALLRSMD